jgi:DNA-binding response OmpR family regulator
MKRILLVFTDLNELGFISDNLNENGFETIKLVDLANAETMLLKTNPDLVVINISTPENELQSFLNKLKTKHISSLLLTDIKNINMYSDHQDQQHHYLLPPLRPKLLLSIIRGIINEEELNWLPVGHQ